MMRKLALVSLSLLVTSLMMTTSVPVAAKSTAAFWGDPALDTFWTVRAFYQPYLDEIGLGYYYDEKGMTITWTFMLAGPVNEESKLAGSVRMVWWQILLDTDADSFVSGWPQTPHSAGYSEFLAQVAWDGKGEPTGILIDKRPSLVGMDAIVTEIDVDVQDDPASVSLTVSLVDDLDGPESFRWCDQITIWHGPYGSMSWFAADWNDGIMAEYPDGWVPWP